MSRLTDDILARVDIVDVVSRYVTLTRKGSNFAALSPFTSEKTPSFIVSPQKQIFKCFSTGLGWNVIKFVMEIEKIDFRDAAQMLAKDAHLNLDDYKDKKYTSSKKTGGSYESKDTDVSVLQATNDYFVQQLVQGGDALTYLHDKRKLDNEIIKTFGLGYAPANSYSLLQYLKTQGFSADDAIHVSLAKRGQNDEAYSFFRNRVTFPIRDSIGRIVAFGARALSPEDQPKYLNSADNPLYEKSKILYGIDILKHTIKDYKKIIVVEGYMDVIGLYRIGMPIGVATCGTALTVDHLTQLKRFSSDLFFLFDSDSAGQQATMRGLKHAYSQGIYPKIIRLPSGYKDVDEMANEPDGKEKFATCVTDAQDGFVSTLEWLQAIYDFSSPVDRQKVLQELYALILVMDKVSMQDYYIRLLGDKLGMNYEKMMTDLKLYSKNEWKFLERQYQQAPISLKKHEPDGVLALASLLYKDFLTPWAEATKMADLIHFIREIGVLQTDIVGQVVRQEEVSEEVSEALVQAQLRRDVQFDGVEDAGLVQRIIQIIHRQLGIYFQQLKTKSVSPDVMRDIMDMRKQLLPAK